MAITGSGTPSDDSAGDSNGVPLCVDCDGTLLQTDLLHEAMLLLAVQQPTLLLSLPRWLAGGKAYFKESLAQHVKFDWSALPYRPSVLACVLEARAAGRPTVLVTASPEAWANGVASELKLFDHVIATRDGVNLSGRAKADVLVTRYGERGFDYIGNDAVDLEIWRHARHATIVTDDPALPDRARHSGANVLRVISNGQGRFSAYAKAMRPHQWLKNLLVLVPLLASHQLANLAAIADSITAFVAFCLCASAVYIINDLLDLTSDRHHPRKKLRPFAAGAIRVAHGPALCALLLGLAVVLALRLPPTFAIVLGTYFALTMAYSLRLNRSSSSAVRF